MRLIIFPFSLKILSKVYFFLMIKRSDETVEFERKENIRSIIYRYRFVLRSFHSSNSYIGGWSIQPIWEEGIINTFDIKQNWKRIYSIFMGRNLWMEGEKNQSLRGNFFFSFFNTGEEPNSSQKPMMENYIIGSEGAVGACG